MNKILFLIGLLFFSLLTGCKHEIPDPQDDVPPVVTNPTDPDPPNGEECDPDVVYFEQDILPFFTARCGFSGCHDSGTNEDGVTLDNYNDIVEDLDIFDDKPDLLRIRKKRIQRDSRHFRKPR